MLCHAIRYLYPDAQFGIDCSGDAKRDYESLEWNDRRERPTLEALQAVEIEADAAREAFLQARDQIRILQAIDQASIRSMREFLVARFAEDPQLPEYLKSHEQAAQMARASLAPTPEEPDAPTPP